MPYVAAGFGATALIVAGIVIAVRSAPPVVDVANRASNALTAALARTHDRVTTVKNEAIAEEKLKEAQAKLAAQQAAQPPANEPTDKPKKSASTTKKKDDPHGGVDGPGFK